MDIIEKLIRGQVKNKYCPIQPKSDQFMVTHNYRRPAQVTPNFHHTLFDRVQEKKIKLRFKMLGIKAPR